MGSISKVVLVSGAQGTGKSRYVNAHFVLPEVGLYTAFVRRGEDTLFVELLTADPEMKVQEYMPITELRVARAAAVAARAERCVELMLAGRCGGGIRNPVSPDQRSMLEYLAASTGSEAAPSEEFWTDVGTGADQGDPPESPLIAACRAVLDQIAPAPNSSGGVSANLRLGFLEWMAEVDREIAAVAYDLTSDDFADYDWRSLFDSGMQTHEAVESFAEDGDEIFGRMWEAAHEGDLDDSDEGEDDE